MRRFGMLALVVGLLAGADEPKKDAKKDAEAFAGSWTMGSVVINGETIPEDYAKTGKLVVQGEKYTVTLGEQSSVGTIKLDPAKTPKQVDFTYVEGPQKGQTIAGIYEVNGESLRICRGLTADAKRPTEFASKADSGYLLVVWNRAKADDKSKAIQEELARFEGTWRITSLEIAGKPLPEPVYKDAKLVLKGDTHALTDANGTTRGTYVIDPTATPKTLDITFTEGPEKGKTIHAIYELDKDTYKVCLALDGKSRPTEFATKPGSLHALEVLKREKP